MANIWQRIAELLRLSRLEKRWQKAARILAVIVVFCTTYMLILPALTMESRTTCGLTEHVHRFSCYLDDTVLICGQTEHKHSDACFIKSTDGNVTDGNITGGDVYGEDENDGDDVDFIDRIIMFGLTRSSIDYSSDLDSFLVRATIKDSQGNPIESGGTVYIGEQYSIDLEFSEVNNQEIWKQFEYDSEGYLTYQLPPNIRVDHFEDTEWRDINFTDPNTDTVRHIGTYYIYDDGTMKVKFDDEANGVNFIDNYTNVDFHVNFTATIASTQSGTSTEIDFSDKINVNLNIDGGAGITTEKTRIRFDSTTNRMEYSVKVEATHGIVKNLSVMDQIWDNHHAVRETIVVTDLDGNILDPQPSISDPPASSSGVKEGFLLTGFPEFSAGEGFYIHYYTEVYEDKLLGDSVSMWNGVYSYGNSSNGTYVDSYDDDWVNQPLKRLEKEGRQSVIKDSNGNYIPVIEWEVEIKNSPQNMNGTVVIDTLGEGLTYYQEKSIRVKRYDANGERLSDVNIPWSDVTINGNQMQFTLPDGYSFELVYYTLYPTLPEGETFNFSNTVKTTVNNKEEQTTGSTNVVGFTPRVEKTTSGNDGKYANFTVEVDVDEILKDRGHFYLTDLAAFWGYPVSGQHLYIENIPEDLIITAQVGNQIIEFRPYAGDGNTENTYILVTPHEGDLYHTFAIYFNTDQPDAASSKWILDSDATITVSYKLPFSARTGTEWEGEPDGDKTLGDVLLEGKKMSNEAYFNYMPGINIVGNTTYEYNPKITKEGTVNEDGTIDYTVVFNNTVPGSHGDQGYLNGSTTSAYFTDTFDEKLEYVPGSLKVTCYDPWRENLWMNKYVYNGQITGNSMNIHASQFEYVESNPDATAEGWSNLYKRTDLEKFYKWVNAGGQYVFTYKLKVKDEYLSTVDHAKLYFDNTAELKWDTDGTSGPVTENNEYETGLIDKAFTQNGSKLDFDIHINRNALDILPGAPTLTIVDTMTHNLSIYWQSIKLLYEDAYGNWIDFDSQQSIYDYEVTYDAVANALTFVVPDSLHIRIDYSTLITESGHVSVNNSVKIDGKAEVTDVVDAEFRVTDYDGGASGSVGSMTLLKHSGITGENLPDAVLALYGPVRPDGITAPAGTPATVEGHGKTLYYIATYTTGPDGTALMENQYLVHGNMYALYEVTPPAGYIKPDEPTFFYFYDKGDDETVQTVTTIITVPNYIEGDYLLPETGGMGTHVLYITGGLLMFLSVVFLLGKRKRAKKRRSDFFGA